MPDMISTMSARAEAISVMLAWLSWVRSAVRRVRLETRSAEPRTSLMDTFSSSVAAAMVCTPLLASRAASFMEDARVWPSSAAWRDVSAALTTCSSSASTARRVWPAPVLKVSISAWSFWARSASVALRESSPADADSASRS